MRIFLFFLSAVILHSACAYGLRAEEKVSIGEVRCVLKDCRQFSTNVLGRTTELIGVTFEIIAPTEFRGKRVSLLAAYDAERGHELLLLSPGTKLDVDLGKADIEMLSDGSLNARSPFDFSFKNPPNQALQHNDRDCHGLCRRTLRASHGRG